MGLLIDDTTAARPIGCAAKWWRDRSVSSLSEKLPIVRETGDPREIVPRLDLVAMNQRNVGEEHAEPAAIAQDWMENK